MADMKLHIEQIVKDSSSQVLLKARLRALGQRLDFNAVTRENMELVSSEMVTNLIKYAQGSGMIQVWVNEGDVPYIDLFSLDYGSGIPCLNVASEDGYSTSGTLGKGLGSMRRLSHESGFYSVAKHEGAKQKWHGMSVWLRFYVDRRQQPKRIQLGSYIRAYRDLGHSGDDVAFVRQPNRVRCMHLDGTGHGESAAEIVAVLSRYLDMDTPLDGMLEKLHHHLKDSAGAAVSLIDFNVNDEECSVLAVGDMRVLNIENDTLQEIPVAPGIVGKDFRQQQTQKISLNHPIGKPYTLIMSASDGLRRNWKTDDFPGLWGEHPQLIAYLLGTLVGRSSDDTSLVLFRETPNK